MARNRDPLSMVWKRLDRHDPLTDRYRGWLRHWLWGKGQVADTDDAAPA